MTEPREDLMNLASALGIDLSGMADDTLALIADKLVAEDVVPTKGAVQKVIAEVRQQESPTLAKRPQDGMHYLATEATDAKYRERMARAHSAEDKRTALYIVPRSPEVIRPGAVHPACQAAFEEDATPCSRCIPLLHDGMCGCDVCDEWWSAVDE